MRGLLVSVVVVAVLAGPAYGDKKPKPQPQPVDPKVPYGMCSVIDVVASSQQHPCPDD
jgi:hypothetical protein